MEPEDPEGLRAGMRGQEPVPGAGWTCVCKEVLGGVGGTWPTWQRVYVADLLKCRAWDLGFVSGQREPSVVSEQGGGKQGFDLGKVTWDSLVEAEPG